MNIREIVISQYREIIDAAIEMASKLKRPPEGWLRTNRKALKIPVSVILKRANIKKSELYRIEKAEVEGKLTLNKLKRTAEAMGCEFHYAIIPKTISNATSVDDIIEYRARRLASKLLEKVDINMQLEEQATTMEQIESQHKQTTEKLVKEMPDWFWEEAL
jgi:predicted DNA-binding mobile mystery protein A